MYEPYRAVVDDLRRRLAAPAWNVSDHEHFLEYADPVLHGYSRHLSPRPYDWPAECSVVGYWPVPPAPAWAPTAALVDFIEAGDAPVYVGFGSTMPAEPDRLAAVVVEAVERSRSRAVVDAGWAGLQIEHPDVLSVDGVDHRWLFPHLSAVVHHAGAGTTGAAVVAGVPSVTVPVSLDQPFWAHRLFRAGVAARPIPARSLSARRLASALADVHDAGMRGRVADLAHRARAERGLDAVLRSVESRPAVTI